MNDDLSRLLDQIDAVRMNRRAFLNRTMAYGATAALGTAVIPSGEARAQNPVPIKGGIFRMGLGGGSPEDSLDPALAASTVPIQLNRQWGDTLVNVGFDNQIEPRIAESFSTNLKGTEWRFKIRQGVKFHDGTDMTIDDVVATFKRHSDENVKSGALGIMQSISSIEAEEDTLVLKLSAGSADLAFLISDFHLVIQPNGGFDAPDAAIGTGPWKLVSAEPGARYVFEKNPYDWDTARGHYDGVELTVINDGTERILALQAGQVDMINRVEPKVAKLLAQSPGVFVENVSGRGHYVFVMRTDTPPFDNKNLRLALKYAINRQDMVDKILFGFGGLGNDTHVNSAYPLFTPLPQREYDLVKAAEYYKASGHDGSPIVLIVAETAFPGATQAGELFQASAREAGIPLEIKSVPDDGYWSDVWLVEPFCASYWAGRPVQDQMYSTSYFSTAEWNETKYVNAELDSLIVVARGETDPAKRTELYRQISEIVHEEGGTICPMFNQFIDARRDNIAGWIRDPNDQMMGGWVASKTWFARPA